MLVLSRKVSERIRIGDEIVLTVIRIGPNSVRFGIEAPKELNIVRDELETHRIQASNDDLIDLGRRRGEFLEADEVADAYVESEMIDHGC